MMNAKHLAFIGSVYRQILFAPCMALFTAFSVFAQTQTGRPDRGTGGKATQAASEIDSINLQNGNVSLKIPLESLPPFAGGKLSYTLNAYYNSSLWNAYRGEGKADRLEGCDASYTVETVGPGESGGWRIGGQYEIVFRDARGEYDYFQPDNDGPCYGNEFYYMQGRFFKPFLRMPDGSEHEMRIDGSFPTYIGGREYLLNYYNTHGFPPFIPTGRLYTVDGTYITATYGGPGDYTIYLKDGTRIESAPGGQRIKDSNGNSILVTGNSAKDEQANREIKWSQTTYNGQKATKVEYQSVGGTWQTVWVIWGTTEVNGQLYRTKDWDRNRFPDGHECERHVELREAGFDVIREIILPATEQSAAPQKYTFGYNSDTSVSQTTTNVRFQCVGRSPPVTTYTRNVTGMGEVSRVITPAGAEIKYHYTHDPIASSGSRLVLSSDRLVQDSVVEKEVVHDGTHDIWKYDLPFGGFTENSSVINPDGSVLSAKYYPTDSLRTRIAGSNGLGGLTYRTTQSGKVMTERHWTLLGGPNLFGFGSSAGQRVTFNPVVDTEYTALLADNGNRVLMTAKEFQYDYNGELLQTIEYDWFSAGSVTFSNDGFALPTGVPIGAAVLRVTNNSYYNRAAGINSINAYQKRRLGTLPVIIGKPQEVTVGSLTTVKSATRFSYDGFLYGVAPTLGNLTRVSAFNDVSSRWIDTLTGYDSHGNVASQTDANNNQTQITYGSINGYSSLYPTQTITAYGSSVARIMTAAYDLYTGLVTTATDVDNNLSVATEYDILGRPTKVRTAADTPLESWTRTEYGDAARRVIVRSDLETIGDGKKVAVQHYDQLGRVRLSRSIENILTEDPYNEAHGIKVETRYQTGNPNSYQLASNPFRAPTATAATNEPSMGWTRSKSWNTGRKQEIETFSGSALPAPWGSNANSTGVATTETDADRTLVADQGGKQRISRTNALGQLKELWEVTAADSATEAISFPTQTLSAGYRTSYGYDAWNNLTTVNQGVQTRTFT